MKLDDLTQTKKAAAGCLIFCPRTNKFLLIQRSGYVNSPLTWSVPGGSMENGERPDDTAIRETMEEIGVDLSSAHLRLINRNDTHAPRFSFYTYAVMVDKEFKPNLNWESSDFGWFTMDELPSDLHWGVRALFSNDLAAERIKDLVDSMSDAPN